MMHQKALLAAALAASVSAGGLPRGHHIAARQTANEPAYATDFPSVNTACLTALASIASSEPTQPAALVSWEATFTVTDPCSYSVPASISDMLSSYENAIESWYKHHSNDLESALTLCPQYASVYSTLSYSLATGTASLDSLASLSNACQATGTASASATTTKGSSSTTTTAAAAAGSSGSSAAAAGSSSASSSSGSAASTATGNVGARETGFFAAVIGAAGLVGVMAAL